ncbi:MAG: hypothetical protein KDJ36_05795 [Hyphomicrobiaceae bacterium]|nr:hypothetical protein [Hyphomicrobiaceae bacterium]
MRKGEETSLIVVYKELEYAREEPQEGEDETRSVWMARGMSAVVKGSGCRPLTNGATRTGADVRKPPGKESARECAPCGAARAMEIWWPARAKRALLDGFAGAMSVGRVHWNAHRRRLVR